MSLNLKSSVVSGALLFLALQALAPARIDNIDAALRLDTAHQIHAEGSLFLPAESQNQDLAVPGVRGKTIYWGLGQPLVLIPFDWLADVLGGPPGGAITAENIVMLLYCPLMTLLWLLTLTALCREMALTDRTSEVFLVFCGSLPFFFGIQSLQEESLLGVLAALAVLALLRWLKRRHELDGMLVGAALGGGLLIRPTFALVAIPLVGLLLDWRARDGMSFSRKEGAALARLTLPTLLLFVTLDLISKQIRFGTPLINPYVLSAFYNNPEHWMIGPPRPLTALSLLFGLGKGALLLSPLLAVGFFAPLRSRGPHRWFAAFTSGAILLSALLHSGLKGAPDGSWSWGARFQVHLLALLVPPTLAALEKLRRVQVGRCLTRTLLGVGLALQALALLAPYGLEYLQNDLDPPIVSFERLLESGRDGHLARRLDNAVHLLRGIAFDSSQSRNPDEVKRIQLTQVPNLWVATLAKRSASQSAKPILFLIWVFEFAILGRLAILAVRSPLISGKERAGRVTSP